MGGIAFALVKYFNLFIRKFSKLRIEAILTSRLFYLTEFVKLRIDTRNKLNAGIGKLMKYKKIPTGELAVDLPQFIDLEYLRYSIISFFCKVPKLRFSNYY